jgi:hypothetical protein
MIINKQPTESGPVATNYDLCATPEGIQREILESKPTVSATAIPPCIPPDPAILNVEKELLKQSGM